MSHILDQTEVWRNKNGDLVKLNTMSGRYATNILNLLRRSHQVVAFRYMSYLASIPLPDIDTVAFDIVEDGVSREYQRIQNEPLAWLMDKPLIKALTEVILEKNTHKADAALDDVQVEFVPDTFIVAPFQVRPPAEVEVKPVEPGDTAVVFLVTSGEYDEFDIEAVYVGNKHAAEEHAAEHNRYLDSSAPAKVRRLEDGCIGGAEVYGQIRRYRPIYTEVSYYSRVNLSSAEASSSGYNTRVLRAHDPGVETKVSEADNSRWVSVVTTGPDTKIDQVRRQHAAEVARVRYAVLATNASGFEMSNEEIDL